MATAQPKEPLLPAVTSCVRATRFPILCRSDVRSRTLLYTFWTLSLGLFLPAQPVSCARQATELLEAICMCQKAPPRNLLPIPSSTSPLPGCTELAIWQDGTKMVRSNSSGEWTIRSRFWATGSNPEKSKWRSDNTLGFDKLASWQISTKQAQNGLYLTTLAPTK